MRIFPKPLFFLGLAALLASAGYGDCIAADNLKTLFFPTFGYRAADGHWEVPVHGWVFEPEARQARQRLLRTLLRHVLRIPDADKNNPLFIERSDFFLAETLRDQILNLKWETGVMPLAPSNAGGHILDRLSLSKPLQAGWQTFGAEACHSLAVPALATVDLLEPQGRMVVSDIDDTIKITGVGQRAELIARTFLKPFEAVPGMAQVYHRWSTSDPFMAFCYMSASPWQLYPALERFLEEAGFPRGVLLLKPFRVKDRSFFALFQSPITYKTPLLEELAAHFPQRQFILVGDSGEKDPEIYGTFARRHPRQIVHIYIRQLTVQDIAPRMEKALLGVPPSRWSTFEDAKEIQDPFAPENSHA